MKLTLALVAALPFVSACAPQAKLLRHYETYQRGVASGESLDIKLSVFQANPKASEESPLVLKLTERAQAELIRTAGSHLSKGGGNAELMKLLAKPTKGEPGPCDWADSTQLSKRLVFTVLGDLATPADRIDKLDIVLTLTPTPTSASSATFLSWDRFTSVYADFNIGAAKFTQSNKLTAGLGSTGTSTAADATSALEKVFNVGYEKSNSLDETASYALRRLTVGGELTPSSARLVQEGAPNITLFGSSIATISFSLKPTTSPQNAYSFVLMKDDKFLPPSEVKVNRCTDAYPASNKDIEATVSGTALVRQVRSGDSTVTESDDDVVMLRKTLATSPFTLATSADLSVRRYGLVACEKNQDIADCRVVHIELSGPTPGDVEKVLLPSLEEAAALRSWLVESSKVRPVTTISNHRLGIAQSRAQSVSELQSVTGEVARNLSVVWLDGNVPGLKRDGAAKPNSSASASR